MNYKNYSFYSIGSSSGPIILRNKVSGMFKGIYWGKLQYSEETQGTFPAQVER